MHLHCFAWAFSICGEWGLFSSCGVWAFYCGGLSCWRAWVLGCKGLSSCGNGLSSCGSWTQEHRHKNCLAWTLLPRGMWDLPGSGIEIVSPALSGGFFTTEQIRKGFYQKFRAKSIFTSHFKNFLKYSSNLLSKASNYSFWQRHFESIMSKFLPSSIHIYCTIISQFFNPNQGPALKELA